MRPPRWDDPIGSACEEAAETILRGLQVRPTLYGFEDGQPTIRVQPGLAALQSGPDRVAALLAVLVPLLGLRQLLLFSQTRTRDERLGEDLGAALATYGLSIEVASRDGEHVTTSAHLLEREVVEGQVRWEPPLEIPDGLWTHTLRGALGRDAAERVAGADPASIAYGLSRSGVVVEVAPGWRERYGFARLSVGDVRGVDRRRVRDVTRDLAGGLAQDGRRSAVRTAPHARQVWS